MASSVVEITLIVTFIVLNGVFAMSEIAVVSARKARLRQRADAGDAGARVALALASKPGDFLSTVQIGITLIGTLAGAFGGATVARQLALTLRQVQFLAPYSEALALAAVVVLITYLSLVIGELVPKRLALNNPESVAARVARPMRALSRAVGPVVRLLSLSTEAVLRLLQVRPSEEPPVTEEEISIMIAEGARAGVFQKSEQDIMANVLHLDEWRISKLMTPRPEIVWLDLSAPLQENWRKMLESGHTQFPVCEGSLDNAQGMVSVKQLWAQTMAGEEVDIRAALTTPLFVPESAPALQMLDLLKRAGVGMALAIDEYGSVQGVVTVIDIMEAIVGDIPSEETSDEPMIVQRRDGSWLLDGMLPIDAFKERFEIDRLPNEGRFGYETLGGFMMMHMGRIPTAGDHFTWGGMAFEVVDMDGLRVDKVLIRAADANAANAQRE